MPETAADLIDMLETEQLSCAQQIAVLDRLCALSNRGDELAIAYMEAWAAEATCEAN